MFSSESENDAKTMNVNDGAASFFLLTKLRYKNNLAKTNRLIINKGVIIRGNLRGSNKKNEIIVQRKETYCVCVRV